jgi:hypothetical protein
MSAFYIDALAQSAVDTVRFALGPPDSVYVQRAAGQIVVGWYPPTGIHASVVGSLDWTSWRGPDPGISAVTLSGAYSGIIDRTVKIGKVVIGTVGVDTIGAGGESSIRMFAETTDRFDTYYKEFDVGRNFYTAGTSIPLTLIGLQGGDTLALGIDVSFGAGLIDTTATGGPAFFEVDLQTYGGFHVWRGLSPLPSHMTVIKELSRDDAYMGIVNDSLYFNEWPKKDARGRPYYEFVDENAFVGFTYYYFVTCFDQGYFKGKTLFNKQDNFICDEDLQHPATAGHPVACESVAKIITMMVDAGSGPMKEIFAVPNPYRSGTSANTTPFYHNFPDGSIKFFHVPKEADIRIFTVAGDLVWEAHHSDPSGKNGVVTWDVKNKHGQEVGSGVYIYRFKNTTEGTDMYGRIVVIR